MQTIENVIARLTEIIEESQKTGSANGLFAALYRRMTEAVRDGIRSGRFRDGAAMERLDVVFANRYLDAFGAFSQKKEVTAAWAAAFETAETGKAAAIQHLLLGMNAHICLDLGIAAAECSPGAAIFSTEKDFLEINDIIGELTGETEDRLARIWPAFGLLRRWARTGDEALAHFSIKTARGIAWQAATELAFLDENGRAALIKKLDGEVAALSQKIARPGGLAGFATTLIRWFERGSVAEKIGAIAAPV